MGFKVDSCEAMEMRYEAVEKADDPGARKRACERERYGRCIWSEGVGEKPDACSREHDAGGESEDDIVPFMRQGANGQSKQNAYCC